MVRYASATLAANPEKTAKARGEYLRTHFKNMREVGAALTGAYPLLGFNRAGLVYGGPGCGSEEGWHSSGDAAGERVGKESSRQADRPANGRLDQVTS